MDAQTGEGVGVARYVRLDEDPEEAEFAIAIADDWQGRGLGRVLLGELVDAARADGLRRLRSTGHAHLVARFHIRAFSPCAAPTDHANVPPLFAADETPQPLPQPGARSCHCPC